MILPSDQAGYITRGHRTTIRIPVDRRLTATHLRPATRGQSKPFRPRVGTKLPISSRDKGFACHAEIMDFTRGPLGNLNDAEAAAEGYPSPDEFRQAWVERHDREWVARIRKYLTEADDPNVDESVEAWIENRYMFRWAPREVWTLHIQPAHDISRYMAQQRGEAKGDPDGQYVTSVATAIDDAAVAETAWLDPRWERRSAKRMQQARTEEEARRRARELSRRLRRLVTAHPELADQVERLMTQAETTKAA